MKHKPTNDFTSEEKEWMDTITVNYIIAQSDGFQLGYSQALSDFTKNIIDYWEGSDDKPQQSILDALVDLGVELGKKKRTVEKNIETAKSRGYERYYNWQYKHGDGPFSTTAGLFTKADTSEAEEAEE